MEHPDPTSTEAPLAVGPTDRNLQDIVEVLLFAADEPLTSERVVEVVADVSGEAIGAEAVDRAVERLNAAYEETGRTLRVQRWAGGYRLATEPSMAPFIKALLSTHRTRGLSRSLMETLAILAYRQPVTKPEIDFVRGVNSDYSIRKLMEYGLVDVVGRAETLGRPLLYGTTETFLDRFGLDTLDNLPTLRELEELLDDPAFKRERAKLLLASEQGQAKSTEPDDPSGVDG